MLNIAFRADGGKNIGLGHIVRCLSLAKAFRQAGHKVYFFTRISGGIEKIRAESFEVIQIPSVNPETEGFFYGSASNLTQEAEIITTLLARFKIDVLVIDSYNVNEEYYFHLKSYGKKIVYIDDLNRLPCPADVIVNGNITAEHLNYHKYNETQLLLLGTRFNMIREEFTNMPTRVVHDRVQEVMITTGGADPYNVSTQLLECFLNNEESSSLRFNVLVSSSFIYAKDLINLSKNHNNVVLYANSDIADRETTIVRSDISPIMLRSDIAISAGGSTLYELAACGTPTIAVIVADNQEFIVNKMHQCGYVEKLGWYNHLDETKILDSFKRMVSDYCHRQKMSSLGQSLVDGKGSARIVEAIISNIRS